MDKHESILIIDDDRIITENLKLSLDEAGYSVVTANDPSKALEEIKNRPFNIVLLDLVLPGINGIELLRTMNARIPEATFIIFTGYADLASAIEALKLGAYDYLIKPFDVEHLKLVIRRALEKHKLISHNKDLFERIEREKKKLEIIIKAYEKIIAIFNLDELAELVTDKAVEILEAQKASLMVVDDEAKELVLKASKGLDKANIPLKKKLGEFIAGWVAREGKELLVADIENEPKLKHYPGITKYKSRSFISLPLKADHRIVGVINVTDKLAEAAVFSQDDLRYLSLLAHEAVAQIENIRLIEKLSSFAITDALTGLFNHRYFQEELEIEILRSRRYKHPLSLIMFDIDNFKSCNDRFGHLMGDKILKAVAGSLRENTRKVDIVSRYGGEEFTVILPDTDLAGAKIVAEKIREAMQNTRISSDTNEIAKVTLSGGVCAYEPDLDKGGLVKCADEALYQAKREGKNKICVFK